MAKGWTAARKKAASERAKARNAAAPMAGASAELRAARKAANTQLERDFIAAAPPPSEEQIFLAQHDPMGTIRTTESLQQMGVAVAEGTAATMTHQRAEFVTLYKPTEYGYFPRKVPVTNMAMLLKAGYLPQCPDCGGHCGTDENSCPGRDKRHFRVCPLASCGRRIYDHPPKTTAEQDESDPYMIRDDAYEQSTPELRLRAAMDAHIWSRHPSLGATMGIGSRLPPKLREVVE